ncbi:MAG TPA: biopolymer transporter ExbD [Pseudoxanthomonas sp.]|jgi:biopolymer transport protein ExbD|nr:biopolymer transporter ExbD [Pseudoxanthomonas sp.]
MAFSASARPAALAEMNVTPLVDVMLVLLIIFMVTAPILSRPLELGLPQPAKVPNPPKAAILTLQVGAHGELTLDDRALSRAQLAERLQDAMQSDPRTVLTLRASPEVDYQQVVNALSTVRQAGVEQVSWLD